MAGCARFVISAGASTASLVRTVATSRHQGLQPHPAGVSKQVGATHGFAKMLFGLPASSRSRLVFVSTAAVCASRRLTPADEPECNRLCGSSTFQHALRNVGA